MSEITRKLLSSKQVATKYGIDVRTVHRRVERGELPAFKLPGETGSYVFDPDELPEQVAS
jgi:predicted DNA-binding transcriptional regulator AlpA